MFRKKNPKWPGFFKKTRLNSSIWLVFCWNNLRTVPVTRKGIVVEIIEGEMWIHILLVVHHFLEWKCEQNSWSMRFPPVSSKNWAFLESGNAGPPKTQKRNGNLGPWAARHMPISKKMFANIVGTAGRWHGLSADDKNAQRFATLAFASVAGGLLVQAQAKEVFFQISQAVLVDKSF